MNNDKFYIEATRCKGCGRILTSKEAVECGYGCVCKQRATPEEPDKSQMVLPGMNDN